jgi:hypothetical protein
VGQGPEYYEEAELSVKIFGMTPDSIEQRVVPRFPLPKEKMKFVFEDGEKVFAVRDISMRGLGISLLEFGESLLFPVGYQCRAELKLDVEAFLVKIRVMRTSAWSVGFQFDELDEDQQHRIRSFLDPLHIGRSLQAVDKLGAPDAFHQGMSSWYHGDSGTDLFLWKDQRGGLSRALFCVGRKFWEWESTNGVTTGEVQRMEGDKVALHRDTTPDPKTREFVRKILEHAEILDYRLVSFLREKT